MNLMAPQNTLRHQLARPLCAKREMGRVNAVSTAKAMRELTTLYANSMVRPEEMAVQAAFTGDVLDRLAAAALIDKSPTQIYTQMQTQIDGWTTLAEAQDDLREWLPLMAAAIVWLVAKDK